MPSDKDRLDFLDEMNSRMNQRNGSNYGWRYEVNHLRISLSDHHFPAKSVRAAIDEAISRHSTRVSQSAKPE